jgi:hypothetical protein
MAVLAATLWAAPRAAAQQNPSPKIEQKDFVKKLDDVRNTIERDRNVQRPAATTDHVIIDVCKRNPQLPQCK